MKSTNNSWESAFAGIGLMLSATGVMAAGELVIQGLPGATPAGNPTCFSATGQLGPCAYTSPIENIIWVAKSGGDYTDPVTALTSISDASVNNPYRVMIGPGVYNLSSALVMKEYVYIEGSGRNVTRLTGSFSTPGTWADATLVKGANNSGLKNLTVKNTCASTLCTAIYNVNASPSLNGAKFVASGGTNTIAIHNDNNSSPTLKTVTALGEGNGTSMGMYNWNNCSPTVYRSTIKAEGVGANYGVFNKGGSTTTIHGSIVVGSNNTIVNDGTGGVSSASIFSSQLSGGAVLDQLSGAAPVCAFVIDEDYDPYSGPACP